MVFNRIPLPLIPEFNLYINHDTSIYILLDNRFSLEIRFKFSGIEITRYTSLCFQKFNHSQYYKSIHTF